MAVPIGLVVRSATAEDLEQVAALLREYMLETYSLEWSGSENALERDVLGSHCNLELAVNGEKEVIGVAAWKESYDLHHCVSGGVVLDLYVRPVWRGRAVAVLLVCAVAAAVKDRGEGIYREADLSEDVLAAYTSESQPRFLVRPATLAGGRFVDLRS